MPKSLHLHRIVLERDGVDLLKQRAQVVLDLRVIAGAEHELAAFGQPAQFAFLDDEGELLPNGAEASSGYVLDRLGRVYAFWVGWDPDREAATFTLWEPVESDPAWLENAEYRRALDALHIVPRGRADEPAAHRYPSRAASITAFA